MRIKICGITNLADARYCAGAGVDYLGFIQFEDSPRYIDARQAREIIEWVHGPQTVGVFVNENADAVNEAAEFAGFDMVQLHGNESPDVCEAIERPVIKAFGVGPDTTVDRLASDLSRYSGVVDYVLLDTRLPGQWGGSGVPFDWSMARSANSAQLFLAGGLTPENAPDAARLVEPFAVDISSGVESAPGQKDFDRIEALLEALAPFRPSSD